MKPVKRGWLDAWKDWRASQALGFPMSLHSYTIERLSIPLHDDVEVFAKLYQPCNVKPCGTILVRSPYNMEGVMDRHYGRLFANQRFQVLFASCRGINGSKGEFVPFQDDVADGLATVEWMRRQTWYTGSFAMMGSSYLGYTQYAVLSDQPSDMKTVVIHSGVADASRFIWESGAFDPGIIAWAAIIMQMLRGDTEMLEPHMKMWMQKLPTLATTVPLLDAVNKELDRDFPTWLRDYMTHYRLEDPYWKPVQLIDVFDRTTISIMLVTGWYDFLLGQVTDSYARLSKRGQIVSFTIGPWTHMECATNTAKESLTWLQEHFARGDGHQSSSVKIFVTGKKEWREFSSWPPPTEKFELYLRQNAQLSKSKPSADMSTSVFKFDPKDPTPSIGSSHWSKQAGAKEDDKALAARSDVLSFTTDPLDQNIEILGKPYVDLHHSTDSPYADILVRVCDVDSEGDSHQVAEIYKRLDPERAQERLQLDLADCAHVFLKGSRIRLVIAGGSNPHYVRNLGSGEDPMTGTTMRDVLHTVSHSATTVSKLVLPIYNESSKMGN